MSVVTATILSAGQALDPTTEVLSIDIRREVDRIPAATLVLLDGDLPKRSFPVSDKDVFKPGQEIEIKLRYEGDSGGERTVFKGLVVRHGIEANGSSSLLTIELRDKALRLTQGRKTQVFANKSDTDVIRTLLGDAGLGVGRIEATQPVHPELVQYVCTDWDFLLTRTDLNGLRVLVEDGKVSARKVEFTNAAAEFDYAVDEIFDFELQADAASQLPDFTGVRWDVEQQKAVKIASAQPFVLKQGNLDGGSLAKALGFSNGSVSHPVPLLQEELKSCLDGRMARNRLAFIRGRIGLPGSAKLALLDVVKLTGMGERFNGQAAITGLRHRVDTGGWRTDLQFGLSPRRFCEEEGIREVPAAGFLPAAGGLQLAVVTRIAADPAKQFRIEVQLAGTEGAGGTLWARWTSPDAAKGRGWFFLPEVGDEVVLAFCNDDPRQPIILGALFSSTNTPPDAFKQSDDKNIHKGIVTKKGTRISFVDEDKPSVLIETPGGNKVTLDDQARSIQLADQHGNIITMDENGIQVKSAKNLQFEAQENVVIKSGQDLQLEASGNVTIKGAKVDVQ